MLCNKEKTEIVLSDRKTTLNSMNIIENCRLMRGKMLGGRPGEQNKKSNDNQKSISADIDLKESFGSELITWKQNIGIMLEGIKEGIPMQNEDDIEAIKLIFSKK